MTGRSLHWFLKTPLSRQQRTKEKTYVRVNYDFLSQGRWWFNTLVLNSHMPEDRKHKAYSPTNRLKTGNTRYIHRQTDFKQRRPIKKKCSYHLVPYSHEQQNTVNNVVRNTVKQGITSKPGAQTHTHTHTHTHMTGSYLLAEEDQQCLHKTFDAEQVISRECTSKDRETHGNTQQIDILVHCLDHNIISNIEYNHLAIHTVRLTCWVSFSSLPFPFLPFSSLLSPST